MTTRRRLLKGLAALALAPVALGAYALGVEPLWRMSVTRYRLHPPHWPAGLRLHAVVLADIHAGEPQMPLSRIAEIVARTNAMEPDVIFLLGDFTAAHRWQSRRIAAPEWAPVLGRLSAPLGVHAILGNHDWWEDVIAQQMKHGPVLARRELERVGIRVYENEAVRLQKSGRPFWLAGLADQIAIRIPVAANRFHYRGIDDLPATLSQVTDDAPVILLAHEPDIFPEVPNRVSLTLSGHTHGGQVRLFGWSPYVPSRFGNRFAYGHVVEDGRNLVVSGGLGCSIAPVRLGVPPEIVQLEIG